MQHHHKDFLGFLLFLVLLFIAWVISGGPQRALQTGSADNRYQDSLAPVGSGQTYNDASQKPAPIPVIQ